MEQDIIIASVKFEQEVIRRSYVQRR